MLSAAGLHSRLDLYNSRTAISELLEKFGILQLQVQAKSQQLEKVDLNLSS